MFSLWIPIFQYTGQGSDRFESTPNSGVYYLLDSGGCCDDNRPIRRARDLRPEPALMTIHASLGFEYLSFAGLKIRIRFDI